MNELFWKKKTSLLKKFNENVLEILTKITKELLDDVRETAIHIAISRLFSEQRKNLGVGKIFPKTKYSILKPNFMTNYASITNVLCLSIITRKKLINLTMKNFSPELLHFHFLVKVNMPITVCLTLIVVFISVLDLSQHLTYK